MSVESSGDARGEAERIVDDYALRVEGEVEPDAVGWDDTYLAGSAAVRERLVAALAAAIEWQDAERALDEWHAGGTGGLAAAEDRATEARSTLRDALSALRARAGEET